MVQERKSEGLEPFKITWSIFLLMSGEKISVENFVGLKYSREKI